MPPREITMLFMVWEVARQDSRSRGEMPQVCCWLGSIRRFQVDQLIHRSDDEHSIQGSQYGFVIRVDVNASSPAVHDDVDIELSLNISNTVPDQAAAGTNCEIDKMNMLTLEMQVGVDLAVRGRGDECGRGDSRS